MIIRFTILGEPASKSNSRIPRVVKSKQGKQYAKFIKSKKANNYERDALKQIPSAHRVQLTGPVRVALRIFYATQRPDLDESVVLDVLQDRYAGKGEDRQLVQRGVICNDRQVREKHVYHAIDRANPRAEIEIEPMEAQQNALPGLDLGVPKERPMSIVACRDDGSTLPREPF